ncbi:TatD family hydrolase [Caldalkalibacillus thermarum TA2.A1]|uniref:TatD family hydrolase n=1 Tax=Caldalkalibacillus thermarum (strain TA2.A1) TaxID=986075 RepID=A0A8X8IB48_CALTT|nr:TatD family hydrolase [Caldalkalibacillus thermarum]QZT34847.1 TatD family hydrolase [Caldalkalibacillus thermarum TA2.A1]
MGNKYIDAHLHLDQYLLRYGKEKLHDMINRWQLAGVSGVVAVSTDLASAYRTLDLKQWYPDFVYAAVGYHPEQPLPSEKELCELFSLVRQERRWIAALGEVGLPHYTLEKMGHPPLEGYMELLRLFLQQSQMFDLPVLLHAVYDKVQSVFELLQQENVSRAHFHWLKAPQEMIQQIVKAGYYVSVTPEVCYRKRDQRLVELVPIENLLVETDGPWPFAGPFEGQNTTPLFLPQVVDYIACLKGLGASGLANQLMINVYKLLLKKDQYQSWQLWQSNKHGE